MDLVAIHITREFRVITAGIERLGTVSLPMSDWLATTQRAGDACGSWQVSSANIIE